MFAMTCWRDWEGIERGVWNWMETGKVLALGSWLHDGRQSSWNTDGQNDTMHLRPHNDQSSKTYTGSEKNLPPPVLEIGPLHDLVTWYKIKYTGEQVAHWDFQNKGRCIVL